VSRELAIPADKLWLGVFSEALSQTTYAHNYSHIDPAHLTPEETAEIALAIYTAWLEAAECGTGTTECPDPQLPESDSPIFRVNPTSGHFEQLVNDAWTYTQGDYAIPPPNARTETTEYEQKCGAASNAANALHAIYDAIVDFYQTEVDPALVQAELAAQIAVAIGSVFGPISETFLLLSGVAWEMFTTLLAEMTQDDWNEDFEQILICTLNSNVTITDGVASFNMSGVCADLVGFVLPVIDEHIRVRWQVWYLLQVIGMDGLNAAGAATAVEGACVTCDTWCVQWTGANLGNGYWSIVEGTLGADNVIRWQYISPSYDGAYRRILIRRDNVDTSDCVITRVGILEYVPSGGSTSMYRYLRATPGINDANSYEVHGYMAEQWAMSPDNVNIHSTGSETDIELRLTSNNSVGWQIAGVRVQGTGRNPFTTGSNC
jgi:hypothetical protein